MKHIIPYGKQSIDKKDIKNVVRILKSDYLTTGPSIIEFERKFADYTGAKYAVAVSSGTAALHLACIALDITFGDEVITSPMTFAASSNCAVYVCAKPVFADIDYLTYNINPEEIIKHITPKTKAIIPVHYAGLPCNMIKIKEIAEKYNLKIIEDACHALGAEYFNTKIGDCTYSDMSVFSFHPVKHITTGEGGMITTNSKDYYDKLIMLRSHGITRSADKLKAFDGGWYYEMQELGYNYRITDIQCALGISQLKKVTEFVKRRRDIAALYNKAFANHTITLPIEPDGYLSSYHLYTIKLSEESEITRKQLYDYLKSKSVYCQVHYIPVHLHPYYQDTFGYSKGDYPIAESYYGNALSIPLYPCMKDKDIQYVIKHVKEFILHRMEIDN